MNEARVTLLGRAGCHLCDDAEAVVARVTAHSGDTWVKVSIDEAPDLQKRYGEKIPVVFVDGREIAYWRVSERTLRAALRR
ncbi:MAG: glutaredoxin family protein [Dermatophilaceae bacterium]